VPAWWRALGLPGLCDIHVHFLPPNVQARVFAQFDQAGPKIGRSWPIRYRGSHEERVGQLRALGARRFTSLPYAHRPGIATYLNEWSREFAAGVEECAWSATFYPEPEAAVYVAELAPTVEDNLNRHLKMADDWMPHEYVPWSLGRDFKDLGGEPWEVAQSNLSPIARTALEVNLLTEDNLPSYHREVERAFGRDSAWGTWVNRWTAEEGRHAFCIRDYLLVTRGVDPDELERARMETMEVGYDSEDKPLLNVCAYVSFQELATRVSHRNTGRYTQEPIAEKLLTRVAKDEDK